MWLIFDELICVLNVEIHSKVLTYHWKFNKMMRVKTKQKLLLLFVLYTDLEYLVRYLESDRRIILSRTLWPSGGYWPHLYVILRSRSVIRGRGCCGDGAARDGPSDQLVCWSHLTLFPHADQVEDGGEAAGHQKVTVHHWNSFKWLAQWNISVVGLQV